jgi:hypothetical protein
VRTGGCHASVVLVSVEGHREALAEGRLARSSTGRRLFGGPTSSLWRGVRAVVHALRAGVTHPLTRKNVERRNCCGTFSQLTNVTVVYGRGVASPPEWCDANHCEVWMAIGVADLGPASKVGNDERVTRSVTVIIDKSPRGQAGPIHLNAPKWRDRL